MKIAQKPTFRRSFKKLHTNQRQVVESAIRDIVKNPEIGRRKTGDLQGVSVYKFKCVNQEYLLAYEVDDSLLLLLALGTHENFYRSLKNA